MPFADVSNRVRGRSGVPLPRVFPNKHPFRQRTDHPNAVRFEKPGVPIG